MSIEDIDFLKKNSIKESYIFLVDSKERDIVSYPQPNSYVINFSVPFKNVIGIDIIDASIPRTMYSVDKYNNTLYYYIANDINDIVVSEGLNIITTDSEPNSNFFEKFDMELGDYSLQTFVPNFNAFMYAKSQEAIKNGIGNSFPLQIKNYTNPPELTNLITFYCDRPFILNMYDSTIAETLGFSINAKLEDNKRYKYFEKYQINPKYRKYFHSIYNEQSQKYEITSPGIVFFIGEKYIILRSPEIEEHAFGSLAYTNYNLGIAKFKVNTLGYNDEKLEITKIPVREFHPIGKLSKLTFRFETSRGKMYDFKGVNHMITYSIYYYKPKLLSIEKFNPILNPNYKENFDNYNYTNDQQELDDDEVDEYSRDNLLNIYKRREIEYEKNEEDEEEDEEEDKDDDDKDENNDIILH